ncbi:hypothetical protein [Streptomyces zhihengii]|uniref:Integral membrane protein n=1 Tax=Streptomyces zhihengii TaxID=1818004 RepID=A0ABS2V5H5_9ACTN|nr:hypothetical protein [Streptomyces zhihengii]MBM9624240.1 hypothetical protein [Streptomyces zhihengii]
MENAGLSGGTPARADRLVRVLSWWWVSAPLLLCAPAIAHAMGWPEMRREAGRAFGLLALLTAVLAPAVGLVVARLADRRDVRGRFLIMAAVSSVPVVLFLVFGLLLAECPDGAARC